MPYQDGTGPNGKGPKTGRGLGPCKDESEKDVQKPVTGSRDGTGRGVGRNSGKRPGLGRKTN